MNPLAPLPAVGDWDRAARRWSDPAFAAARSGVEARAALAIDDQLWPVAESAGWGHAFFCPDHVEPLEFDPQRSQTGPPPYGHRCPVDGRRWVGEDFDGGWIVTLNARIMGGIRAAALMWRLGGDRSRLDWARSVILRYAEIYRDLTPSGRWLGKGKVTGQSLEEAVWAIGIIAVIDQLRTDFTTDELQTIRVGLIEPLADHLMTQRLDKIHNIECWHLAAIATLGVVLEDDDLVEAAVDGPTGLAVQFDRGIRADGWWVEGSAHYHFYMATALLHTVRVLRERRPDLVGRPELRQMMVTPLTLLRPDLSLPAHNDGWHWISMPGGLGEYLNHYEIAHALWDEPVFARVVSRLVAGGAERRSEDALLLGPDLVPVDADDSTADGHSPLAPFRDLHPDSGWAVQTDGDRFLVTKFGPHGGGHGHPDKLQLDLWAHGERLAPDFGSPNYTSTLQGPWYRHTLSHNTLLVGDRSQPRGYGRLLSHEPGVLTDVEVSWPGEMPVEPWLSEPDASELGPYDGVTLRRTVLWHEDYFIELSRVSGAREPTTWAFHHRGERVAGPQTSAYSLDDPDQTWSVLADLGRHEPATDWSITWRVNQVHSRFWANDPEGTEVIEAQVPGAPPADLANTVLRRTDISDPLWVSVVDIWIDHPRVTDVRVSRGEPLVVEVVCGDRTDRWELELGEGVVGFERVSS